MANGEEPLSHHYRLHIFEHLAMGTRIMRAPKGLPGCIIECGCCKGGSSANLSLVAKLCGRTLNIFDSFCGLPSVPTNEIHKYTKRDFCGSLQEVQENIRRWGALDWCRLQEGFFLMPRSLHSMNQQFSYSLTLT